MSSKKAAPDLHLLAPRVMNFGRDAETLRNTAATLAPRFLGVWDGMRKEIDPAFTFLQFVRALDPTIPMHAADRDGVRGYRNHPTYTGAMYLRRIAMPDRHKYREMAAEPGVCDECGLDKRDHQYGDVVSDEDTP
jgi:hypothetical protein